MTLLPNQVEDLVKVRDKLLETILNLEMGLQVEKRKLLDFEFYRNDKNYDVKAMDEQIIRSKENIVQIKKIIESEKQTLATYESQISEATKIVSAHGIHICLTGAIPHNWNVISRHNSGKFSHRVCTVCGTTEKVGVV